MIWGSETCVNRTRHIMTSERVLSVHAKKKRKILKGLKVFKYTVELLIALSNKL